MSPELERLTAISQRRILIGLPPLARVMTFAMTPGLDGAALLELLSAQQLADEVVGLGAPLLAAVGAKVPGARACPARTGPGLAIPSTQQAIWLLLAGDDHGELVHRGRQWASLLRPLRVVDITDTFIYAEGRDLSGYVDGTENPEGERAVAAALAADLGPGLDGGSFLAVQRWVHDLDALQQLSVEEQDDLIGRRRSDNEEFDEAPVSAHVKRAAQESFQPTAFMLRRSMPWADQRGEGLLFLAYGKSFDAFEAVLSRMIGAEDGSVDGLFSFTRPVSGGYYWCPPVANGRLDLSAVR